MNVLFVAENPLFYVDYAVRLENNNLPFWTAHTVNDLHLMVSRMTINVVFADYNFLDFSKFDVYKHIKEKEGSFILLFLNEPHSTSNLFIQWEDRVNERWPDLWNPELESLLRIVANQPYQGDPVFESHKVQDLLDSMEHEVAESFVQQEFIPKKEEREQEELSASRLERKASSVIKNEGKTEHIPNDEEKLLISEYLKIKKIHKISFTEFLLLDLLRRRKNAMVSLADMMALLEVPENEKNVRKIYRHIHCLRNYLEKEHGKKEVLVRIKKGIYSLICEE
ncbi:MAG: hypothetical protein U0I22_06440 [Treponema sp.]|nr:hypothetical protein [Treponema sp.]